MIVFAGEWLTYSVLSNEQYSIELDTVSNVYHIEEFARSEPAGALWRHLYSSTVALNGTPC